MQYAFQFLQPYKYNQSMSKFDLLQTPSTHRSSLSSTDKKTPIPFEVIMLMHKMEKVSSSTNVDMSKNVFKLMDNEDRVKFKEDPITKLKNLQNRSEANRASVQLLAQRKPKKYSGNTARSHNEQDDKKDYLHIYKELKSQKFFPDQQLQNNSEDEEEDRGKESAPQGITNYRFLKEYPKVMNYALVRKRNMDILQKNKSRKEQEQLMVRQASRPSDLDLQSQFQNVFESSRKSQIQQSQTSKQIIENQLGKFYSKSTKGKMDLKVKDNPRCTSLLRRQDQIMSTAEEKQVSKEYMKKLKSRLNEIVNEINKDDRKSRGQEMLPRIMTNSSHFDTDSRY